MRNFIANRIRKRFFSFVDRRNTCTEEYKLTQKNLYILPSKSGFIFLMMLFVMWLIGTNYQNNLILALVFILLSLFFLSIFRIFSNLVGLSIIYNKTLPAHAGDNVIFLFSIVNGKNIPRDGVAFCWQDNEQNTITLEVDQRASAKLSLPCGTVKRGVFRPPRMKIQTYFPFGLFRCWTWAKWDIETIIYPKLIEIPSLQSTVIDEEGDGTHPTRGGEDYSGLHEYRAGDSLKHVAWKAYAKEQGLFTKEFSQNLSQELWLDLDAVHIPDMEKKLSGLAFWAHKYHLMDENYGLKLAGQVTEPNKGEVHLHGILRQLSLY